MLTRTVALILLLVVSFFRNRFYQRLTPVSCCCWQACNECWHFMDPESCEKLGEQFEFTECCSFPAPQLSKDILSKCQKDSMCELFKCLDTESKFRENGKLQAPRILSEFQLKVKSSKQLSFEWTSVIEKSIETCNGISEFTLHHRMFHKTCCDSRRSSRFSSLWRENGHLSSISDFKMHFPTKLHQLPIAR